MVEYKCDYPGCNRKPFAEIFFVGESAWCYLCFWHFIQERRWKNMWCLSEHLTNIPIIKRFWAWYAHV